MTTTASTVGQRKRGRKPKLPEDGRLSCGKCKQVLPAEKLAEIKRGGPPIIELTDEQLDRLMSGADQEAQKAIAEVEKKHGIKRKGH